MSLGNAFKKIKQDVLDETARHDATRAMIMKDKKLDPQSLRDDIDSLSERLKDLEKQIQELRKR